MSSVPPPHQLTTGDGRWLLKFEFTGDRYSHTLVDTLQAAPESAITLRSVEGKASDDWPSSPAIQQISTESIDGVDTILGVGCCGTSHFSVSVQVQPDADGESSPRIHFQWAVRLTKALEEVTPTPPAKDNSSLPWLGSSYSATSSDTPVCQASNDSELSNTQTTTGRTIVLTPKEAINQRTVVWSYFLRVQ